MPSVIIELSEHAKARIKQRRISRTQVRVCLIRGRLEGVDISGRKLKRLKFGKRILEVVYLQERKRFLVVTAFWKDIWP